jgi:hypothetical protein
MDQVTLLLKLGMVIVVAVGAVWLLLRVTDRPNTARGDLLLGYPPDLFPARDLTRSSQLAALTTTQARLHSIYAQLPPHSDLAIWLRAFLNELREIMDTAYRVAVITQVYGQPADIDRLIAEVQQIEAEVAGHVARRLLARDGDAQHELLEGRLAALRMCVRELATLPAMPSSTTYPGGR